MGQALRLYETKEGQWSLMNWFVAQLELLTRQTVSEQSLDLFAIPDYECAEGRDQLPTFFFQSIWL